MKQNPKRIPRTQVDVDRAWEKGALDGVSNACAIFLTVLVDKYGMEDKIPEVWADIRKLSEEVREKRVTVADLRRTLLDEYGIKV